MNGNPTPESSELIPYIKERKRTGAQKIIFLIAIIGIIAAICITLIKSSGGFLSGLFGKSAETTTSAPETTTSPSQKENIYDYDPSAVPEGKKGVIPADLSAEKQGRRFSSDGDISHDSSFLQKVTENKISVIFWVPTVMISVANGGVLENADLSALKLILFAGEVMPNTQLNIWRKYLPDCMYVNMYGPTEATDIATYYIVDREYENHETLPIGKVCRNMRALILNDDDKQCAVGEQGELCISGTGIALGYWNSPEITAKAFVQNPLNTKYHDRIYRTGDLVYENEEGNIIFIGRKDSQIKLRGNRIELGDLESAAAAIENVASACALFDADKQEIVLFIETTAEIVARKFKMELKKYVPAYMVPGKIVTMEKFPHTPSGKIDRVGLRKTKSIHTGEI